MKRIFIIFLMLFASTTSWASSNKLVIIADSLSHDSYQLTLARLLENIPESTAVTAYNAHGAAIASEQNLIPVDAALISIGPTSYEVLETLSNADMLALLISENRYASSTSTTKERTSAIFIKQPISRITSVLKKLFKNIDRVGIIISKNWTEKIDINDSQVDFVINKIDQQSSISKAFREASISTDLIIALPDPVVYNRTNIKNILLTTYKFKTPLVGYSEELSKAGALISVYTPGELLGLEAAEWFSNGQPKIIKSPRYYKVQLNENVAKSLGKKLKDRNLLQQERWED